MSRADTSREARAAIEPTRISREAEVLDALGRFRQHHGTDPTAYELLRWMQVRTPALDLNGVRPRLTELKEAGYVETGAKRVCAVTDKRVYTWRTVRTAFRERIPAPHVRVVPVQEALF